MKTALAAPDDGPDKKKYGIPPKDKKGLSKKTEYKYESKQVSKTNGREKKHLNYGSNTKDRYSSARLEGYLPEKAAERKKPPKDNERKTSAPKQPHLEDKKRSQMEEDYKRTIKLKKDYKVVENKIKKPEEKANKLRRTASRSKTSIRMKKKDK